MLGARGCVRVLGARTLGGGICDERCTDTGLLNGGLKDIASDDDVVERYVEDVLVDDLVGDGGGGLNWGWCTLRESCAWIQRAVRSRVWYSSPCGMEEIGKRGCEEKRWLDQAGLPCSMWAVEAAVCWRVCEAP